MGSGASAAAVTAMAEQLAAFTFLIEQSLRSSFPGIYTIYGFGEVIDNLDSVEKKSQKVLIQELEDTGEFTLVPPDAVCRYFTVPVEDEIVLLPGGVNVRNDSGWTPLHACCHSPVTERAAKLIIREVVATNGDLDLQTKLGPGESTSKWTALHIATAYGLENVVQLLIKEGADPNTQNSEGWSPLMEACRRNFPMLVRVLIAEGVDANQALPHDDRSPGMPHSCLAMAARHGYVDVARKLLDGGAKKDLPNDIGWTPLHEACHMNELPMVQLFIMYGADVCAKTSTGRMPHDLAFSEDMVQCLQDAMSDAQREYIKTRESPDKIMKSLLETVTGTGAPVLTSMAVIANKHCDTDDEDDDGADASTPSAPRHMSPEQGPATALTDSDDEEGGPPAKTRDELETPKKEYRLLGALPDFSPPSASDFASPMSVNTTSSPSALSTPGLSSGGRRSPASGGSSNRKRRKGKRLKSPRRRAKNVPEDVPNEFICAVSGCFMREPVRSPYGHTFDKRSIRSWLKKYGRKCPFTGLPLSRSELIPALELRRDIENFRKFSAAEAVPKMNHTKMNHSMNQASPTLHHDIGPSSSSPDRTSSGSKVETAADDMYDFN